MIRVKRAYEPAQAGDGQRFLVDHLWPRGLSKSSLRLQQWVKAVAPSTALRKWFDHDPAKWTEFRKRYIAELDEKPEAWQPLLDASRTGDVSLVFSARDPAHNNALVLQEYLSKKLRPKPTGATDARASRPGPASRRRAKGKQ